MKFLYYDIIFLIISSVIVALFLYKNRKKLEIESKILLLYKTKIGINAIEKLSKRSPWVMKTLVNLSIISGYFLMIGGIFFIWQSLILIINAVSLPKIPPIFPLVPYLPDIFKISFLPPFYFTYWIITIAIVAVSHEFSHGIFARFGKIRLKSTGFGFLGPFLAAFVELDEKQMAKKPIKTQLSVLAGGTFANLLVTVFFMIILNLFFMSAYSQAGMSFNTYTFTAINISNITSLGNAGISNPDLEKISLAYNQLSLNKTDEIKIVADEKNYFINAELLGIQLKNKQGLIVAYEDTPAYNNKITGAIKEITSEDAVFKIKNHDDLSLSLDQLKPGDNITVSTTDENYSIILSADPNNSSKSYLGIGILVPKSRLAWIVNYLFLNKKDYSAYYEPKLAGEYYKLTIFIYNLLIWIVLINASVMLVNMLPFGIFDGGRFFYLSVLGLTRSKKVAEKSFKIMNSLIMALLILLMVVWFFKIL